MAKKNGSPAGIKHRVLTGPKQASGYNEANKHTDDWQTFKTGGGPSPGYPPAGIKHTGLVKGHKTGGPHKNYQRGGYDLPGSGMNRGTPTGGDMKTLPATKMGYEPGSFQANVYAKGGSTVGSNTPAKAVSTIGGDHPRKGALRMSGHPGAHLIGKR